MYTVINVVLGYQITVTFICNESQVQEVIDFIGVCEGSAVDIIEQVEANFDCRAVSPATYDPFNWDPVDLNLEDMAENLMEILVDNVIDDAEVIAEAIWDLFIPEPLVIPDRFMSIGNDEEYNYPRTCSNCGKGMYEGYCIDNGEEYYCSDDCLYKHYTEEEYLELYDDGNGDSYWTEWEEDEEDEERSALIYEYETKIAKAKRNNDTEAQYYYQDKLDELLREDDLTGLVIKKEEL